ncbi:MAG: MarR family transcriptional regulator [Alphaproteobacteria bacterium]|nr:MarR family transcriptional regulator [Alphaproteobacteria bacterium]
MPAGAARFVDGYLAYLLARASHLVSAQFHARLPEARLSVAEWRVLCTLSDGDRLAVGALARFVLHKQPTLTKILDRMARRGWVKRAASEADGRIVLVRITAAGRRKVAPLLAAAKRHEADVLAGSGGAEAEALKAVLRDLIARCAADSMPTPPALSKRLRTR